MGRRSGRAAAKRAAAALEDTPQKFATVDEDESMADADAALAQSENEEEAEAEAEAEEEEEEEEEEAEDETKAESGAGGNSDENNERSGAEEAEAKKEGDKEITSAKSPSPPPQPVIRRKRLGRPPKNRPPDWDQPTGQEKDEPTPRRRGRGGYRGRGGRKGQHSAATQQPVDKDGNLMEILNDEIALPEDLEGEAKVDKLGNLQGGRDYRCRTFTIRGRGERLYMLSTEPARCVGFRDSYLFFTKHRKLYKIIVEDEEKRDMIEREIIPHSYKGRSIGVVTARSVFREFGALIIVGGRRVVDDYEVTKAREEGVIEGELADPNDNWKIGEPYNKNQYVAWHGASAVYHQTGPVIPLQQQKAEIAKKRRVGINDTNWMLEHAREASQFNSQLAAQRAEKVTGVYDVHTNMMLRPAAMQPTHVRIEQVTDPADANQGNRFAPVGPRVSRNFYVTDTYMQTPQGGISSAAYDNPGSVMDSAGSTRGEDMLAPYRGLSAVSEEIKGLLPPECRQAFDEALTREVTFKEQRRTEAEDAHRRAPRIDKALFPYSINP